MNNELNDIVDDAYRVFANYRISGSLDVCTECCVPKEDANKLLMQNVRQIPSQLLMTWNHAAKPKLPDLKEFKHFLPRFLDLVAQFDFPSHSVEITLKSFRYFPRNQWTKSELKIIDAFGSEFFKACLKQYPIPAAGTIEDVLIMLSQTIIAIEPLLEFWKCNVSHEAALHFADFFTVTHGTEGTKSYVNGFANECYLKTAREWIRKKDVANAFFDRIESICFGSKEFDWEVERHLEFTLDNLPRYL